MKLLFFSTDRSEVELLSGECTRAGISCEIHERRQSLRLPPQPREAELWLHRDRDCYRAVMLCFELGIGFARRPHHSHEESDYLAA